MSEIEGLIREYKRFVQLRWDQTLTGPEKVWFAVYDPVQERRLRFRVPEFESATKDAGHAWKLFDLTNTFADWMAQHEYQEEYFEAPELLKPALKRFTQYVSNQVIQVLTDADANTVVAMLGLASLFGLTYASTTSDIFNTIAPSIQGRLLVFFPGQHNGSAYRLLDARDGWNYLAVPITGEEGK